VNKMVLFVVVLLAPLNLSADNNVDCYDEIGAMLRGSIVAFDVRRSAITQSGYSDDGNPIKYVKGLAGYHSSLSGNKNFKTLFSEFLTGLYMGVEDNINRVKENDLGANDERATVKYLNKLSEQIKAVKCG